ncbi:2-keto-4-pentenoate hydratase/2-oxohepta-3-ene-1,7-dioic acid hydratase (catechol pathway) [Paenibacillus catalpae]|uniref:2-keto-4-pentenoate hydratase/2-oxohepta-3-ene-1,7-dioic acid hydratase (Catechol pathway) n=1 Tax=Paenibacillus catalpae TaxID=1045775 RepID=A0A1I2H044_9BACL|nr:fumarylacetoacetate hydrolase family protein [Paenibacillus catalpae]SFF22367.1 2-keto-4-pentenoate hydratase/2-oxohepta-3-ene-1,7-dioic acid hydratase (catechol pathway) [Paenibacillus catalpae]
MKLATIVHDGVEQGSIAVPEGYVTLAELNRIIGASWRTDVFGLITNGQLEELTAWYNAGGREKLDELPVIPVSEAGFAPLYRHPRKIWGIGMNYTADADELAALREEEPVSFMKPDTTIIGNGEAIVLPPQSQRVTAEAELAIVIGRTCRNVTEEAAPDAIAGMAAAIDTTASDIHARHMRYLTRAKSFDTFFTFGSELITPDEAGALSELHVETWHNGGLAHASKLANMIFPPAYLIAFHSQVMTLLPGDVILTGTPGAAVIRSGDRIECRVNGLSPLRNEVR